MELFRSWRHLSARSNVPHRQFWQWLNGIFNKVDEDRIKEVGPDRAAAEWLLRCGAAVKWQGAQQYHTDYNSLPTSNIRLLKIEEIDATDSSIMYIGFPYLKGLEHVKSIKLHKCAYITDEALHMLAYAKKTLRTLHVTSCGNVTDDGVKSLAALTNLEYLKLFDLFEVRDKKGCLEHLRASLQKCQIEFPDTQEEMEKK
ncbi:ATP synthase subunit s, mitochondrial-like [Ornithodoros turicata]